MAIGKTVNLRMRSNQIRSATLGRKSLGEWGLFHHVHDLCGPLRRRFGPISGILKYLVISFHPTKKELLKKKEQKALEDYVRTYAELPPMNCQMPGYAERI